MKLDEKQFPYTYKFSEKANRKVVRLTRDCGWHHLDMVGEEGKGNKYYCDGSLFHRDGANFIEEILITLKFRLTMLLGKLKAQMQNRQYRGIECTEDWCRKKGYK